ncbi:MAG: hypothetical protein ACFFG0_08265 [Candidatus Thorarchaeota archaeon]
MILKLKAKWEYDNDVWFLTVLEPNLLDVCIVDIASVHRKLNRKVSWCCIKNGKGEAKTIKEAKEAVEKYLKRIKLAL